MTMADTVRKGGLYPVAEGEQLPRGVPARLARVKATGEFRTPREGEWYLSGAIMEGFKSGADLSTPFHIGALMIGTEHTSITWKGGGLIMTTHQCACGAPATLVIAHECELKRSLRCTGMFATCDTHVAADLRGEIAIAAEHGPTGAEHAVKVRLAD